VQTVKFRCIHATRTVNRFVVPRLGVFLFELQHSVPGIPHNASYWLSSNHQFETWMSCLPQVLILPNHQGSVSFSRMVTKRKHQMHKEIMWIVHRMKFVWNGQYIIEFFSFVGWYLNRRILRCCWFCWRELRTSAEQVRRRGSFNTRLSRIIFHVDPLMRRVNWNNCLFNWIGSLKLLDFNAYELSLLIF
jgi:hypothetical protein